MRTACLLLFCVLLSCSAFSQRRTGKRITSFDIGLTISAPQNPLRAGLGGYIDYQKCYPVFLGKRPRGGATPPLFFELGVQYNLITLRSKKEDFHIEETFYQQGFMAHAGAQYVFSMTSGDSGPWGRQSSFGFLSINSGLFTGYSHIGKEYKEEGGWPLTAKSTPLMLGYYVGVKTLSVAHGISVNFRWNHNLIPVFSQLSAKTGWISTGLGWNRLESECQKYSRKMKRILPTLGQG